MLSSFNTPLFDLEKGGKLFFLNAEKYQPPVKIGDLIRSALTLPSISILSTGKAG